ncbi:cell division transport system permease protein [Rhodobacter aestuarii]|uniref:Cell division transport system permease protein n=1 Tax=Rhodobacter aestuarii TaxID=453582 RepID=A0A1N7Q7I9_9RHOB|nr:cell division protein FtsX [Rhodobacter aestuarii]PTV93841.1 cell division transport system permease protein [Rhodobacter aestuarii]SIT18547.1 cell division transport system permease protein [Rhodobacter aestuarii]
MRLNPFSRELSSADRVVPPTGFTANLTVLTAAAMAFLAVFALALSLASGRLADRWAYALARSATIRISAPPEQMEVQTRAVLDALATTPGVKSYRPLEDDEMRDLLDPWFGPDLPVEDLPLPQLVELVETAQGIDAEGLRLRLAAEAPGAVLDDHTRWRRPLVAAADKLRWLGWLSLVLIGGAMAGMITLAAQAALAANGQVIRTLRLVGAQDAFIARAFVRRFTQRGFVGAALGTGLGMGAVALLPAADAAGGFLTGLGFTGTGWLWPLALPVLAAVVAYGATRAAALRMLKGIR